MKYVVMNICSLKLVRGSNGEVRVFDSYDAAARGYGNEVGHVSDYVVIAVDSLLHAADEVREQVSEKHVVLVNGRPVLDIRQNVMTFHDEARAREWVVLTLHRPDEAQVVSESWLRRVVACLNFKRGVW